MSWFFGQSEGSKKIEQINQKFEKDESSNIISIMLNENIIDEENIVKIREMIMKTICDFLYYYPKINEAKDNIDKYYLESEQYKNRKHKVTELVKNLSNEVYNSKIECIIGFLKEYLLSDDDVRKLTDHFESEIINFLSSFSESELIKFSEKIGNNIEIQQQLEEQRQSKLKFVNRIPEIMGQVPNSDQSDLIITLLREGMLKNDQYDKYLVFLKNQTLKFLSEFSLEDLRQLLCNLMAYKQLIETNKKRREDIEQMRHRATVKNNIPIIEKLSQNRYKRPTKIINTRAVVIPDAFIKKMGDIHKRKIEEIELPTDNKIIVKEYYSNGQLRLKGQKIDNQKFGTWSWYNKKGEVIAEYDYSNQKWFYNVDLKTKIKGIGLIYEFSCSNDEFLVWLKEANYCAI